jgi:Dolichyl-phosphate-mannose-protein mannosyltransferase
VKERPRRGSPGHKAAAVAQPRAWAGPKIVDYLERHSLAIAVALILFGSIRIVATYHVFNHTVDEPAHIACGMEWLDKGVYTWEAQHPPLARVASAIGPYLLGIRSQNVPRGYADSMQQEGVAILYKDHHYDLTLFVARLGILPFFWVGCLAVYWWGKRYFDPAIAVLAVFAFSFEPTILAHAGLATTDMALTAFLGLVFVCGAVWLEEPTWKHAVWFGGSGALAILSKFSSLLFFPASAAASLAAWYLISGRPRLAWGAEIRKRLPTLALAAAVAFLVIWAGYRFSVGSVDPIPFRIPAPELVKGVQEVQQHNTHGHPAYLLGEHSDFGWWYFFEVALAVKTPLGFLGLLAIGTALALAHTGRSRSGYMPLAFSGAILFVSAFSHINIGLRHVMPVYLGFSILVAIAVVRVLEMKRPPQWAKIGMVVLAGWFAASSLLAHPDYLPYFNVLAGSEPEKILVESDLDWGQDMKRLSKRLHDLGVKEVSFTSTLVADFEKEHGFPRIKKINVDTPNPGWNAVGVTTWKQMRMGLGEQHLELKLWADTIRPTERVGKSIVMWYFPYPKKSANSK